jgi:hypothetical protein
MGEAFKTDSTRIALRPTGPLVHDPGSNLLPTLPAGFFPPPLGTELRRNLSHTPRSIEAQIISGPRRTPRRRCHSEISRYSRWPTYLVLRWN